MNNMIQFFRQLPGKLGSNIYAGIQGQPTPQQLSFLRQLQKEMKEKNSLDIPLAQLNTVVFDLETTGFYPEKGDQIISIGAVKMSGFEILYDETFYSLIKSSTPLPSRISSLTNIKEEQLHHAPEAGEVLMQFFKFVKSNILVAHHSHHERSFMQKMTRDLLKKRFDHRILDTSFLIYLLTPSFKSMALEDVCKACGVEVINRHHALGDAMMTAQIWRAYLCKAQSAGYKNFREIYEDHAKLK